MSMVTSQPYSHSDNPLPILTGDSHNLHTESLTHSHSTETPTSTPTTSEGDREITKEEQKEKEAQEGYQPPPYSSLTTPFSLWSPSPIGTGTGLCDGLDSAPITPWSYPSTNTHTPLFAPMGEYGYFGTTGPGGVPPPSQGTSFESGEWQQPTHQASSSSQQQQHQSGEYIPPSNAPPFSSYGNLLNGEYAEVNHHGGQNDTGLSPMFAYFNTNWSGMPIQQPQSHALSQSHSTTSTPTTSSARPAFGPMRGFSYNTNTIPPSRKRSSTLMTVGSSLSSTSPGTPSSSYSSATYPYPSPRSSISSSHSQIHHPHPGLHRHPSAPSYGQLMMTPGFKRYHPTPATSSSANAGVGAGFDYSSLVSDPTMINDITSGGNTSTQARAGPDGGTGSNDTTPPSNTKPARFRPTKEQLSILITAYDKNKNPDAATRDDLARQLGPDIRPKTLQIWFQNRRSKSRAKEREANIPRPLHMRGARTSPTGGVGDGAKSLDVDTLRQILHDDTPGLMIIPLSVLSISSWTRFLTPGMAMTTPDLACAMSLQEETPKLFLYVVYDSDTFRITVPIEQGAISDLSLLKSINTSSNMAAMRFEVLGTALEFCGWTQDEQSEERQGSWTGVGDFTGGAAGHGGRCELTGDREILSLAYTRIQDILNPSTHSGWTFPSLPSLPALPGQSHTAVSPNDLLDQADSSSEIPYLNTEYMGTLLPTHDQNQNQNQQSHNRQRSFSAPQPHNFHTLSGGESGSSESLLCGSSPEVDSNPGMPWSAFTSPGIAPQSSNGPLQPDLGQQQPESGGGLGNGGGGGGGGIAAGWGSFFNLSSTLGEGPIAGRMDPTAGHGAAGRSTSPNPVLASSGKTIRTTTTNAPQSPTLAVGTASIGRDDGGFAFQNFSAFEMMMTNPGEFGPDSNLPVGNLQSAGQGAMAEAAGPISPIAPLDLNQTLNQQQTSQTSGDQHLQER